MVLAVEYVTGEQFNFLSWILEVRHAGEAAGIQYPELSLKSVWDIYIAGITAWQAARVLDEMPETRTETRTPASEGRAFEKIR